MNRRDDPDLRDLRERLGELEATLSDLRAEVEPRRRGRPRPPTPRELLRVTEEYTIPTVIALLEATIRSLKLLQRLLRLADPERAARAEADAVGSRVSGARDEAADALTRTLAELRRALDEGDLPTDPDSRAIVEEAQSLSAEIESRLRELREEPSTRDPGTRDRDPAGSRRDRGDRDGSRRSDRRAGDPVTIDVVDADDGGDDATDESHDDGVDVDVEAELDSIRKEVRGPKGEAEPDDEDGDGTGVDPAAGDGTDGTANDEMGADGSANDGTENGAANADDPGT